MPESDRDALIAAVLAAPADDAPRLILADLLEEIGVLTSDEAGLLRHGLGHWRISNFWPMGPRGAGRKLLWAFPEQTFPASGFDGRDGNFAYNPLQEVVALVVGPVPNRTNCWCLLCHCQSSLPLTRIKQLTYDNASRAAAGWVCDACLGRGGAWS